MPVRAGSTVSGSEGRSWRGPWPLVGRDGEAAVLVEAIRDEDPDEQRWAEYELASQTEDPWPDEECAGDQWSTGLDLEDSA